MKKAQLSHLTVGLVIAIGTVSQGSPSWAATTGISHFCSNTWKSDHSGFLPKDTCKSNTVLTRPFTTPKGDGVYGYDPTSNRLIYSIGDQSTAFSSFGVFHWDPNTLQGTNYGTYKEENGGTGTYSENFPLSKTYQAGGSGGSNYDANSNNTSWSQGDPNSSSHSSGGFKYDPTTSKMISYGTYSSNGFSGSYYQEFGPSNVQAVPEPDSALVKTLALGAVLGAGLMLKRQQKKTAK